MRNLKKMLSLLSMAVALGAAGPSHAQQSREPIKVGVLLGLTGPAAAPAQSVLYGVRMWAKELNDAGGLIGRPVQIVQADDQFNPAQGINEARRLTQNEKVNMVIGPQASHLGLAVAPVMNQANIVWSSTSVTPDLNFKTAPMHFSGVFNTQSFVAAMVSFARNQLKVKRVALIADNGAASKAAVEEFRKQLPAAGIELVAYAEHEARTADAAPQLLNLRRANPELLLQQSSTGEDGGMVVKSMQDIGWTVPVLSSAVGLSLGGAMKVGGPDIFKSDRLYSTVPRIRTYCANEKPGTSGYAKFLAKVAAFEPATAPNIDVGSTIMPYEFLNLYRAAVEATKSVDGATLTEWMKVNAGKVPPVASSPYAVNRNSHFLMGEDALVVVKRADLPRAGDKLLQRDYGC